MHKTYRVGIIGSTGKGNYGHDVDVAFTKLPNVEIVAVADDDDQGRESAKQRTNAKKSYANYRQMLETEKLDIVAICPRWKSGCCWWCYGAFQRCFPAMRRCGF